jgi:LacI family transcriptional regulator
MSGARLDRRATLADVAARASVSRATASRALADDPRISQPTRVQVRAAADALGYVPNIAARSLRARHTRTLGLLLPDLGDPVHAQVASGFELEAGDAGYAVIIMASDGVAARERQALTVFLERTTDGICIASTSLDPRAAAARVAPTPLVTVQPDHASILTDRPLPDGTIRMDEADGVRQAVDHLVDLGMRDVAYLGIGVRASDQLRRTIAVRTLLARTGLALRTFEIPDPSWRRPELVAAALGPAIARAVLCYDDRLALALLDGLRDLGARVPEDVAVVGYDGIPFAALSRPRLTTVVTPAAEIGRLAATSLVGAIRTERMPEPRLLPVELVVRESTVGRSPDASGRTMAVGRAS